MTQDPSLSPDKVAELEHKLADAAAEVAKVQAQLNAAQSSPSGTASGTAPGTPIPGVPYGGADPAGWTPGQPHVIMINGQQVAAGSGQLAAMLQQFMPQAGAGGTTIPPVVSVNGQVVSGGQPIDLSTYLTPQVADKIRSSLSQLGLDHQLGAMFGATPPGAPPEPQSVAPLAEPPRPVPFVYKLATFNLSVYELFCLIIGFTAPIAVWLFLPEAFPIGLVVAVLLVAAFRIRRYVTRIGILKWGKVATVTNRDLISEGTYYSGMTYNNMRLRQATGWDAVTTWYSGPGSKTKIDYTVDGVTGSFKLRGLPYANGVILADPRKPSRAMCVSQFPYSVKPEADGQFPGRLTPWLWGGIIATLLIEGALVYLAVLAVYETFLD